MVEYGRRAYHSVFVLLVLLAALSGPLSAADEAREALPLVPGNYWIYRGTSRFGPGGGEEPVECEIDIRVLVTDVRRWEHDVCLAMLRKTSTPLSTRHRTEYFDQTSEVFAYFVDHNTVYEIRGDTVDMLIGNEYREELPLKDIREKVADDAPAFVFPLTDGQRFAGRDGAVRRDDDYKWVVTKGDPIDLLGRRHIEVYVLRHRSLSGTTEIHFIPGIGIVGDQYVHHGTIIEWDSRLVAYHLEKPDSGKRESGSQAED